MFKYQYKTQIFCIIHKGKYYILNIIISKLTD